MSASKHRPAGLIVARVVASGQHMCICPMAVGTHFYCMHMACGCISTTRVRIANEERFRVNIMHVSTAEEERFRVLILML